MRGTHLSGLLRTTFSFNGNDRAKLFEIYRYSIYECASRLSQLSTEVGTDTMNKKENEDV